MGRENKKWRRCQLAIAQLLCVASLVFPLSVFSNLCIMNTPLHFLVLICQSCHSLRNVSFGGHILGLIKSAYHGWLSMMASSEGPFLVLLRPPNLKSTTVYIIVHDRVISMEKGSYFWGLGGAIVPNLTLRIRHWYQCRDNCQVHVPNSITDT